MDPIAIVDAARTPHGRFLGSLSEVSSVELGTTALEGLLERTDIPGERIDWVGLGNSISAGLGQVPARQVTVNAGLADETPATTVNEASGSGLRAVLLASDRITAGRIDVAVAGGFESMSNAPYLVPEMRQGRRHGDATLVDSMIRDALWDEHYDAHMGSLTEELVERFDVSREAQDEYALRSHRRAGESIDEGRFEDELVPVDTPDGHLAVDEGPRPDTSLERLGELSPSFEEDGTITAGNASDLSDGAGCVLLASEEAAEDADVDPLARIVDYAVEYDDPKWFGKAVGDAVGSLLEANDLDPEDVDHFEINEAFAAPMVHAMETLEIPEEKFNPYGGAIALGHPIGASGGILTTTLAYGLEAENADRGVVGMSVGGGGGIAALLER
ncbi:thiolase family protein [Natrialbaceae archaeon GCM10025810]|uniref:thiolase family protein n=1 Tax=Halovalidus salilacus TaxID=3075124 RepID=UPI003616DCD7